MCVVAVVRRPRFDVEFLTIFLCLTLVGVPTFDSFF